MRGIAPLLLSRMEPHYGRRRTLILAHRLCLRRMADLPGSQSAGAVTFALQARSLIVVQDATEACLSHTRMAAGSDAPVSVRDKASVSMYVAARLTISASAVEAQ